MSYQPRAYDLDEEKDDFEEHVEAIIAARKRGEITREEAGRAIESLKQSPRSWQRERRDDVDESFDPDARPNQPNARRDFLRQQTK